MEAQPLVFDHVNLATVDPSNEAIKEGIYELQVVDASVNDFLYGPATKTPGEKGQYIKLGVAIVDNPDFRGRRVYNSLFTGNATNKQLRILMDATGVPQGNQSIPEWLSDLKQQKARFQAPVYMNEEQDKQNGGTRTVPRVKYWGAQPSQA